MQAVIWLNAIQFLNIRISQCDGPDLQTPLILTLTVRTSLYEIVVMHTRVRLAGGELCLHNSGDKIWLMLDKPG